jgi:hypothetical protein
MYRLLVILFALSLCISCKLNSRGVSRQWAEADTPKIPTVSTTLYFPQPSKDRDSAGNTNSIPISTNVWYSKLLFGMHEPLLYGYSGLDSFFRFTWLRTFNSPVTIMIRKIPSRIDLRVKILSGMGCYDPGHIISDTAIEIQSKNWEVILAQLNKIDFWNLAGYEEEIGTDGAEWILEGNQGGKYHFVDRWSPNYDHKPNFRTVCENLIELSRIKVSEEDIY